MPFGSSRMKSAQLATPAPPARAGLAYRPYQRDSEGNMLVPPAPGTEVACNGCSVKGTTDQSKFRPMTMQQLLDKRAGKR